MEQNAADISIGLLEPQEVDAANEVWLPNYTGPREIYKRRILTSPRFFIASVFMHMVICWLFSVPLESTYQLITFSVSVAVNVVYIWICWTIISDPGDDKHLYQHWTQANRRFLVARDEAKERRVVGTVAIQRDARDPSVTELFRFRVLPEYHRRGIGARLNEEVERLAREDFNCRKMILGTVAEHETGIAFYVRNGYKLMRNHRLPNPYLDPRFFVLEYEKELS